MRSLIQQLDSKSWSIISGPIVVLEQHENCLKSLINAPKIMCAGNRDGPLIFYMRDGPPNKVGPSDGLRTPDIFSSGFSPPKIKGQLMEWLAEKKTLDKFE